MNAPIANDDTISVLEDELIIINVLENDTDADNDLLSISSAVSVNGTVVINPDGTLSYTANENYNGTDVITYEISDGNGGFDTATVSVTVEAVNDAPNAVDNTYTVDAGHNANVTFAYGSYIIGVLANDSDAENDAITMTAVNGQALVDGTAVVNGDNGGVFTVNANGTVHLDASSGFEYLLVGETTTTSFTYTITDANGAASMATTTVTVNGMNDAVKANADDFSTTEDEMLVANVLDDQFGDALYIIDVDGQVSNLGQPIFGSNGGYFVIHEDGSMTFEPEGSFDHLTLGESEISSINITIGGGAFPLTLTISVTVYGNFTTNENEQAAGNVLTNDFSFDGDKTVTKINDLAENVGQEVQGDNGGIFIIAADGTSSFDPNGQFEYLGDGETETTTVTYTIEGYAGEYSTSTVSVTVTGVNDAPTAVDNTYTVDAGHTANVTFAYGSYIIGVLANDSDAENDAITMTAVNGQALVDGTAVVNGDNGGVFTVNANGTVHLDASSGFEYLLVGETTTTSFTYTITDANGAASMATTTVTVNGMNDAVKANADDFSTIENDSDLALNVLSNDFSFDGQKAVTAVSDLESNLGQAVTGNNGGVFTINADGSANFSQGNHFDYLSEGETITTSVTYTVTGYAGENSMGTASVTVTGVNDAPNAVDNTYTVNAGHNANVTFAYGSYIIGVLANASDADNESCTRNVFQITFDVSL
jgi:hypothetical protein